jgi:hypothetical protein
MMLLNIVMIKEVALFLPGCECNWDGLQTVAAGEICDDKPSLKFLMRAASSKPMKPSNSLNQTT